MRNLLAMLAFAALVFIGLGWYLDWYQVKTQAGPAGHHTVNIDVNSPKIMTDVHKGVQKGEEKLQSVLDKKNEDTTTTIKPTDSAPPPSE